MTVSKIRLEKFDGGDYATLISWVDSEETLMQFAGPGFSFPLTSGQLDISLSDEKRLAFSVVDNETNIPVGHAEIYLSENSAKLGRVLIGHSDHRGKGLGQQIVNLLLGHIFYSLDKTMAELNVFDWNISAIKCYEKAGFSINPGKRLERKIKNETWIAINMTLDKSIYEQKMINNGSQLSANDSRSPNETL